MIYMTTHLIDESLYVGKRKRIMESYATRDPAFVDLCVEKVSDAVFLERDERFIKASTRMVL